MTESDYNPVRHVDAGGFYVNRRLLDHRREIWTVFCTSDHFELLRKACNDLRVKHPIDVSIYTEEPWTPPGDISVLTQLRAGSNMFLLDTAFLVDLGERLPYSSLFPDVYSDVVLYANESDLEVIHKACAQARGQAPIEHLHAVRMPSDSSASTYKEFLTALDEAVASVRTRRVFLCHASEDREFVAELAEALHRRGIAVWYDRWALAVGDSIVEKINEGIERSRFMGVVLSPRSVGKPWCVREMNSALQRQLSQREVKILPILIEDCNVPPLLSDILWADFRTSFDEGLATLLKSIQKG